MPGRAAAALSFDGSALTVLPAALRPGTAKAHAARAKAMEEDGWPEDPGELRKAKKRTAELAAVADVLPAEHRTADDLLAALFGPARVPGPQGPGRAAREDGRSRAETAPLSTASDIQLPPTTGKTRIVYCKDSNRRHSAEHTSFTFLGFTFRPRQAQRKDGVRFTSFLPAISKDVLKKISAEIRSWRLHRWVNSDGREIAKLINPKIRGSPGAAILLHDVA